MATPNLLLFGTPGAGKSALLEAIVEATRALKADLVEKSDILQHYHVQNDAGADPFFSDVAVLDSNGKAALEMLQAEEPFKQPHPLRKTILAADVVVIAVDVSAPKKQLHEDFRQVARWLKHMHEFRGLRTDVAELPVYVVLTKCDLLATKDDTLESWQKRVDEAKRQYLDNFSKYVKKQTPGFGTIKLKVLATSIKQPPFGDKAAKSQEPFGIVDLFRECLESASDFQNRRSISQGRLQNVVVGILGLIALLALTVTFLAEFQPKAKTTTLDEKIQPLTPLLEAKSVDRLRGGVKKLDERLKKLTEIEEDSDFPKLPDEQKKLITSYREELAEYLPLYQQALTTAFKLPHDAGNDAALKEQEKSVLGLALPTARAKDWTDTDLGRRMRKVRAEYETLHAALKKEAEWIRDQVDKNKKLLEVGDNIQVKILKGEKEARQEAKDWQQQYDAQIAAAPPMPRLDQVAGLSNFSYGYLNKFEPVKTAMKDWQAGKDKLTKRLMSIQNELKAGS